MMSANRLWITPALLSLLAALAGCSTKSPDVEQAGLREQPSSTPAASDSSPADPYAAVNTVAKDRETWQGLLRDHAAIRRTIVHTPSGVEALTESDDPAVAAKIIEHARAMQVRMKAGAPVRIWDNVFAELFKHHGEVKIDVSVTANGVRIIESSSDPEALALLRSHAMGVSEFVRQGQSASPRQTARFKVGDPLPAPELAIGGVPHRILLSQPDAAQLAALRTAGVGSVLNFRIEYETPDFDERAAVEAAGMTYERLGYRDATALSDRVFDAGRAALARADQGRVALAIHCRTGNRVGPVWAAYRVLNQGVPIDRAIDEAKAMQMIDPRLEARTREYIQQVRATHGT